MNTIDDGNRTAAIWLGYAFKSVDWLVPAYLQMGFLHRLALRIFKSEPPDKLDIFREAIAVVYGPQYLATVFLERYSKIAAFIYVCDQVMFGCHFQINGENGAYEFF